MKVLIPTALRQYTDKQSTLDVPPGSVAEVLGQVTTRYPELRKMLFSDDGKLRKFVNVYVNDEDIRFLKDLETPINDNDTLSIILAIAGGRQ